MRENIFYWKCDNPLTPGEQKRLYLQGKYDEAMGKTAQGIAEEFFRASPESLRVLGAEGNHFVYLAEREDRTVLLRTDDGQTEDDYLGVESAVMELARTHGVPVPEVYQTDVSLSRFPVRYQVMEYVDCPSLAALERAGTLDRAAIARECGVVLRKLHSISTPGYGFFDTAEHLYGLDESCAAYFNKRLADHLNYLAVHSLLDLETVGRIRLVLERALPLLDGIPGVLLHRDFAFWNLLGTPRQIVAVIDWDDAVSGDPADDFGILNCFHEKPFLDAVLAAYGPVDEAFRVRIELHTLRNMLWKAVIRHRLGYFEQGGDFFLTRNELGIPMKEYTLSKLLTAMKNLENAL